MKSKNSNFYFPELDGLRFFAFFLVFLHHSKFNTDIELFNVLKNYGWIGVDLFFSLSAFLITSILHREFVITGKINIKKFYLRRIYRIWPIYFITAIGSVLFFYFQNANFENLTWFRLFGIVTFTDNIFCLFFGYNHFPGISHLWTISYEEQFYLIVPLFLIAAFQFHRNKLIRFIFILFLTLLTLRVFIVGLSFNHPSIWVIPLTHFDSTFFGLLIGLFGVKSSFIEKFNIFKQLVILMLCIMLLFILPSTDAMSQLVNITYFLVGVICSLILILSLRSGWFNLLLKKNIFVYLGRRSYGMYLFHLFCIDFSYDLFQNTTMKLNMDLICFIISLLITILLSVLSYSLIEKPFLLLKKNHEIINSRPV